MTESRHALIIANDSYEDRGLKKLRAPAHDAVALADVLQDPEIGDFDVEVVRNQPAHIMRRRIEGFFKDRRRDDTLVLHFSCHGLKSESGELYFAASDTEPRLLDATAVPAHFVRRCMKHTRARSTVLFLDCCYGGAFSRGSSGVRASGDVDVLEPFAGERPGGGRGWAVITASNSMEYAFEGPDLAENSGPRPSVFTHAVVQGLETGEADLDEDGEISLDDLYDYVFDQVREQNPNQTPSRTVEMQGDMRLARSRRRRIRIVPAPVPAALRSALDSRNNYTRLGAVAELRSRMENENLSIAEGARQALEETAHNDVRQVADEACRALRDIRPKPLPSRLDFGRLPRGSPPPHCSVSLDGPPLARCCMAHATTAWLRVRESATGMDVSVDTSAEGHLSGEVVLKGVADDAVVHVEAEIAEIEHGPPPGPTRAQHPSATTDPGTPPPPADPEPKPVVHHPSSPTHPSTPPRPAGPEPKPVVHHPSPTPPPPPPPQAPTRAVPRPSPGTRPPPPPGAPPPPSPPAPRSPKRAADPKPGNGRSPARSVRAPVLATVALALAATSVVTVVLAAVKAAHAAQQRSDEGRRGQIEEHVSEVGMFQPLTIALITAVLALALGALARHELSARHHPYPDTSVGVTKAFTWTAKLLAIPALILAAVTWIAYLVARGAW